MGRSKINLCELFKTLIINDELVFVRECPTCGCDILYKGKSKRWNVKLGEKNKTKCSKCQNKNQIPWNVGIPMSEESKSKSRNSKIGKSVHTNEYKEWLKQNSPFNGVGENSIVIKTIMKNENITYDEYITKYNNFIEYERIVNYYTKKQSINNLKNSDKKRGRCGDDGAYQLDHIISIKEGFDKKINPQIIGGIDNLQFIPWKENLLKSKKYKNLNN
jgi:hypothetical protein